MSEHIPSKNDLDAAWDEWLRNTAIDERSTWMAFKAGFRARPASETPVALPPNVRRYKVQQDKGIYALKGCDDGDLVDYSAYEALLRRLNVPSEKADDVCKDCGIELVSDTCDKCGAENGGESL